MTAPAYRMPTPLDLARRAHHQAAPLPGPDADERKPFLPRFEAGIRGSRITPYARLVALTLATLADHTSGVIPPHRQPSLTSLEHATGLTTGQVKQCLKSLDFKGWVRMERPAGPDPRIVLTIPPRLRNRL